MRLQCPQIQPRFFAAIDFNKRTKKIASHIHRCQIRKGNCQHRIAQQIIPCMYFHTASGMVFITDNKNHRVEPKAVPIPVCIFKRIRYGFRLYRSIWLQLLYGCSLPQHRFSSYEYIRHLSGMYRFHLLVQFIICFTDNLHMHACLFIKSGRQLSIDISRHIRNDHNMPLRFIGRLFFLLSLLLIPYIIAKPQQCHNKNDDTN